MPTAFSRIMRNGNPVPKSVLIVLNQLYQLEHKLKQPGVPAELGRTLDKMRDAFAEEGFPILDVDGNQLLIRLAYEDPLGQGFKETRTDLDATIAGPGTENLVVVEVIKPIIRAFLKGDADESSMIIQKGVVIVTSQEE